MAEKKEFAHIRPSCCTSRGIEVDLLDPKPESINLADIAEGLSKACRYSGQVPNKFYSVAEHSVLCSYYVPDDYALMALMHDAAEAYTGDFSSPLKALIRESTSVLDVVEDRLTRAIFKKFSIEPHDHEDCIAPIVHEADGFVFVQERNQMMPEAPWWSNYGGGDPNYMEISCHDWRFARHQFTKRFNELWYGTQNRESTG